MAGIGATISLVQRTEGLEHQAVLFPRRHFRTGGRMSGDEIHESQDVGPQAAPHKLTLAFYRHRASLQLLGDRLG